jgi:hypothetical protein
LGWVLLEQKLYEEAEKELRKAVDKDEKIPAKQFGVGVGMAYCLLPEAMKGRKAQTNEKQRPDDKKERADDDKEQSNWDKKCMSKAFPETLDQYKWFVNKK